MRVLGVFENRAGKCVLSVFERTCARDKTCASWCSRLPTVRLNDRRCGLALVVQRLGNALFFIFARRGLNPRRMHRNNSVIQRT